MARAPARTQPAEWAPHSATWLAWPSAEDLWRENLVPAQRAFAELCRVIADPDSATGAPRGERIELLVPDHGARRDATRALEALSPRIHLIPFGDIWLRDTAPIFVHGEDGATIASCFEFNGWGKKFVLSGDAEVAERIAAAAGKRKESHALILEGGSVEVDGEGTVLTTRQCLLHPNRNPTLDQGAIESRLRDGLGADKVLWITEGLQNDHTDGHVDTIARFVAPGVVVCMAPESEDDPNATVLRAIAGELEAMTDARGRALRVVRIPSPGRVTGAEGEILPASYVNFYIANRTVAVPTYGSPNDDAAVLAIARLFPERRTVGIDARAVLTGGGAFHCITQQEPRARGAAS